MKQLRNSLSAACMLLLFPMVLCAQERTVTISGKVLGKDNKGAAQPLPGATIHSIDGTLGTQADADGKFSFSLPDSTSRVVVSHVGYSDDTLNLVNGTTGLQVTLKATIELNTFTLTKRRGSSEVGLLDPVQTLRINQRELLKAACCNLSESFETTPSVDVAFTDAISGYKQIQMLGLAGPYTYITRENIPDNRGLAAITGLTFTPGTWIHGMQLSKGTGSVVNGYESVAGQINIELWKPFEEEDPTWIFNLYQSTQGRTEGNVVYRHQLNEGLSTNLMLHGKSQWLKIDQNGDGFMDQPMDKQFVGLNRWFYFSPKGLEIQAGIKGAYVDNTGGQLNYTPGTEQIAGNPWGFTMNTRRVEGWAKIGKVSPTKTWRSVGLQLSGVYHNQDALYGTRDYNGTQKSLYANLIYQSIISNTNNIIKFGVSTIADRYDEVVLAQTYGRNEIVPGAFAEYAYTFKEKFNLVAGIRGDYHNLYGAFATPRLHLRYAPWKDAALRASVGRAQRTANIFAENMGYMASNRLYEILTPEANKAYGLDPEVAWNYGVNFTQKFMINYRDGALQVDYYYTDFKNQVVVDIEDPHAVRFYNLDGQSFANSLQAQLDYEVIRKLDVRLAYRWYDVRSTYMNTLKQRPLVAAHRAFVNIGYETKNAWKFDYTFQWIGSKRVPRAHSHNGGGAEYQSPSFTQMSAQITKSWNDDLFEVYVGGENLTNFMQHDAILGANDPFGPDFDASLIWGPVMGRNVYAGFRYKIKY